MVGQRRLYWAVIISVIFHGLLVLIFQNQITKWDVKEYTPSHPAFIVAEIQTIPPPQEEDPSFQNGNTKSTKQLVSEKSRSEREKNSAGNETQDASIPETEEAPAPGTKSSRDAERSITEVATPAEKNFVQSPESEQRKSASALAEQADRRELFSRFQIQAENSEEKRFREELENYIEAHKKYPETARRRGITGTIELELVVNKDLSLKQCSVLVSSGSRLLDRDAEYLLRSFFEAQRSQAIYRSGEHTMTVHIAYNLE